MITLAGAGEAPDKRDVPAAGRECPAPLAVGRLAPITEV